MNFDTDEYFGLSRRLECHHALFYTVWNLGVPIFSEIVPTAGVRFNDDGDCVEFVFNPKYWENLSEYERVFVICHECLHVILHHGHRIRDAKDSERQICNIALDVVVNHSLVNHFGFDRYRISNQQELCWVDTVFPGKIVPENESFEYYFNLISKLGSCSGGDEGQENVGTGLKTPDDHSMLGDSDWEDAIGKVSDEMSDIDKSSVQGVIEKHYQPTGDEAEGGLLPGVGTIGSWTFANVGMVQVKRKWETVIKKWSLKYDRPEFKDVEQWARLNRRFSMIEDELMLPSEMEQEFEVEGKVEVWFFQDTSGSCAGYRDRFFKAAMSLSTERFHVRLFCFDTQVYETSLESKKIYGGGGTCFAIIENHIQQTLQSEMIDYPEAVFVITDGCGTKVVPQKPQNWYVFLTTKQKSCFPNTCHFFQLKDYE